jgi:hypothetical protein
MDIDQVDDGFWENASIQGSKSEDSERSSKINVPLNQPNKETQPPNFGGRPKGDVWQFFVEINNGRGKHKGQFVIFVILHGLRGEQMK